jgi:hypothetical protein
MAPRHSADATLQHCNVDATSEGHMCMTVWESMAFKGMGLIFALHIHANSMFVMQCREPI